MNTRENFLDIDTIQKAIAYWCECLAQEGSMAIKEIAGDMVRVGASDHEPYWYETYPEFAEIFDMVCDMEWENYWTEGAQGMLDEIKVLLDKLEEKVGTSK